MENDNFPRRLRLVDPGDFFSLLIISRITTGGQNHTNRCPFVPRGVLLAQGAIDAGFEQIEQVTLQTAHEHLRFGIAEPAVKLQHLWPVLRNHETRKEHALEHQAIGLDARHKTIQNF